MIDARFAGVQPLKHPKTELAFLTTEYGNPFTAAGFGNKFRTWCNEAKLPPCCPSRPEKRAGDPGRIRTCNPQSRNLMLYPVELRDRTVCGGATAFVTLPI